MVYPVNADAQPIIVHNEVDPHIHNYHIHNNQTDLKTPQTQHFFRKRTMAQLQPYHYERQIYEMQLKRRGIKPLRVSVEKTIAVNSNSDDSQFIPHESSTSSQTDTSVLESSQVSRTTDSLSVISTRQPSSNINNLSRQRTNSSVYNFPSSSLPSARKFTSTYSRRHTHSSQVSQRSRRSRQSSDGVPARRASQSTEAVFRRFDIVTSDDDENDDDDDDDGDRLINIRSRETDSSDSDSSESGFELELERLKRRVKGVLPPSFLTLEHARSDKEKVVSNRRPNLLTQLDELRKGFARKKIGPVRSNEIGSFNIIGDSDPDDNIRNMRASSVASASRLRSSSIPSSSVSIDSDSGSDMEVTDHIDRMAGRTSRPPRSTQSSVGELNGRKRNKNAQTTLRRTFVDNGERRRSFKHRHKETSKHKPRRKRQGTIGIIDAYVTRKSLRKQDPLFLRVAVKEAAKRRGYGRDSPTRKFFQFDDDDEDESDSVADVLQQWREGTHEAFETASVTFTQRSSKDGKTSKSYDEHSEAAVRQLNRRLPLGIMAIVPPPKGVMQVMGPPPVPRRNPFLEYEEVESGEYVKRHVRHLKKKNIDVVCENATRLGTPKQKTLFSSPALSESSSRQRPSFRKPPDPRHVVRRDSNPAFSAIVGDEFGIGSTTAPVQTGNGSSALQHQFSSTQIGNSNPQVIDEFCFPVLNFSVTFDVVRLLSETRFRISSFIGRGALESALHTPSAVEEQPIISMSTYTFAEREQVFFWQGVTSQVLEELQLGYDIVLDWALNEQHNADAASEASRDQAYEFCIFLVNYIRSTLTCESYDKIILFASTLKRLAVRVMDLFTQFHNRTTKFSRISFYMLAFQLLYTYEIYAMLAGNFEDYSHLALDREFTSIGQLLLQVLLKSGIDDLYQFLKTYCNRLGLQITKDAYFVEIWIMTMHTFDFASRLPSSNIDSFWKTLYDTLDGKSLAESVNITKYERAWYATFAMCPLYQFDGEGVYDVNKSSSYWPGVESMMATLLNVSEATTSSREFVSYCRACFARCLTLSVSWNWSGTKSMVMIMHRFFAKRKFENLEPGPNVGFPNFLQDMNYTLELSTSDTIFHIFLKYLAKSIKDANEQPSLKRTLPGLIGLVTPLNGRLYPRTAELKMTDLEALENNYGLLLTLYWAAPAGLRPTVGQLRDVIVIRQSHSQARLLSVKTWYYLTRLQLREHSDIFESGQWYQDLLKDILDDLTELVKTPAVGLSLEEQRVRRANLRGCESLLRETLKFLRVLVCSPNLIQSQDQTIQLFRRARIWEILNVGANLPETVVLESLQLVQDFIILSHRTVKNSTTLAPQVVQTDSLDTQNSSYGDDSALVEVVMADNRKAAREAYLEFAKLMMDTVFKSLYHLLSNLIGAAESRSEPSKAVTRKAISTLAMQAEVLVLADYKDWNYFIEGRGAWKWFADTERRAIYEPYWLEQIALRQEEKEM
ncbi:Mus7/MMS22 family-domain-containing protein [Lipomyces arxii]|uniref:Mus7/MMS22 family-domain-containing protein n=1 Tax=Lipomyces arxii TaxID=56418 RepID=UPI0034CDCEFF